MQCKKCGHVSDDAHPADPRSACPNCGAIYAKVEEVERLKAARAEAAAAKREATELIEAARTRRSARRAELAAKIWHFARTHPFITVVGSIAILIVLTAVVSDAAKRTVPISASLLIVSSLLYGAYLPHLASVKRVMIGLAVPFIIFALFAFNVAMGLRPSSDRDLMAELDRSAKQEDPLAEHCKDFVYWKAQAFKHGLEGNAQKAAEARRYLEGANDTLSEYPADRVAATCAEYDTEENLSRYMR